MTRSVKQTANRLAPNQLEVYKLLTAVYTDLAALRAAVVAITAKLDLDATVTDTDYASTCNPAALQTAP